MPCSRRFMRLANLPRCGRKRKCNPRFRQIVWMVETDKNHSSWSYIIVIKPFVTFWVMTPWKKTDARLLNDWNSPKCRRTRVNVSGTEETKRALGSDHIICVYFYIVERVPTNSSWSVVKIITENKKKKKTNFISSVIIIEFYQSCTFVSNITKE